MIGTYYRLSLADEDVGADKAESNSIQGQRGLVEGYIMARPELATEPRQEYVDDGYSGTSTSRPAFQRLIQDAQDGKVKTIIVKDFSRFARDYIEAEIVKQRVALYEQYADGNISKEEFVRQRDAYRAQEDEKMEQIQRLRTEKNQAFQPVKRDTDHLQTVISTVEEAGDVMHLSQNVVETFIDRIEVFNDERVKIHFTFEDTLNSYEEK